MRKVVVYIATSLNGYIASKNDDIAWLEALNEEGEDYGFAEFRKTVDVAIMGARTYTEMLVHPERILMDIKSYVLSDQALEIPQGADIEIYSGDAQELVERLKKEDGKNIFVIGGGQVVSSLLNKNLIDEIIHFVAPVLIEDGIPLYTDIHNEKTLLLQEAMAYPSGLVKLHYVLH